MLELTMGLPTVELIGGDFYWVRRAHEKQEVWTIALWQHGSWWDLDGKEFTPRTISGPIPRPDDRALQHPGEDER